MNLYDEAISAEVSKANYFLGKELNSFLEKRFGVNSAYARKLVQRATEKGIIKSSDPITFGNGQFAYFGQDRKLNKEMILKITRQHRPPLYRILCLMDLNDGIISFYEALKVSGAMLDDGNGKIDKLPKLIDDLEKLGLVMQKMDDNGIRYLIYPTKENITISKIVMAMHYSKMKVDVAFFPDIIRSLKNYNIIDNDNVLYRSKSNPSIGIKHNSFIWDVIAYTKTTGINPSIAAKSDTKNKQTLVVLDIIVNRPYTDFDLQGFHSRVASVYNSVKEGKRKVLPIVVYNTLETKILSNRIAKLGFLKFDLNTLYGANISSIIETVQDLKRDSNVMGEYNDRDAERIDGVLKKIRQGGQETNLQNIKGDLFEFLLYPLITILFPNCSIQQGRILKDPTDETIKFEYDYIIYRAFPEEYIIIEAKGLKSSTLIPLGDFKTHNTIKWFFSNTLVTAKRFFKKKSSNAKITPCYITSAGFKDDAIEYLKYIEESNFKSDDINNYYDGDMLLDLLEKKNLQKVKEIVQQYYRNE